MNSDFKAGCVSVIIPTWNRAEMLSETLQSILAQTYRPIEVIVVDDGSTDHTEKVISEFLLDSGADDFELRYIRQQRLGASVARNRALAESQGEYIQFLDSDDLLHSEKLSKQVEALGTEKADFVWSSSIRFTDELNWDQKPFIGEIEESVNGVELITAFIKKSLWRTESGLYRRYACLRTGDWKVLAMFQDWEYNIRMLSWGPKVTFVPGVGSAVRVHDMGRIGDKWSTAEGLQGALQAVELAVSSTRGRCHGYPAWFDVVKGRFQEIADRADLLGFTEVKDLALKALEGFLESLG